MQTSHFSVDVEFAVVVHFDKNLSQSQVSARPECVGLVKAGAHLKKVLSKIPREAVSSAVSSRVRWSFRELYASRRREENICRV